MKILVQLLLITSLLLSATAFATTAASNDFSAFFKPIAPWTGQIILPEANQRAADGSVPFLVYTSPKPELIGRVLRLAWNDEKPEDKWFQQARPKVVFDAKTRALGEKHGCRFPTTIDGWEAVSALESLPANRSEGTIEVVLKQPELRNGVLFIHNEPAQVNGSHVCLARFEGPADGSQRKIRHFNPRTGFFTGPVQTVTIMPGKNQSGSPAHISTDKIEESPLNARGWYLYGKPLRGTFLVKAIEPRDALMAWPVRAFSGKKEIADHVSHHHFKGLKPMTARVSVFEPRPGMEPNVTGAGMTDYAKRIWPVGTRALLIHLFGWRKFENGPPAQMDGLAEMFNMVNGHFSFGMAEVVKDPFTGEPRWDIEYKQVYSHNREEVVCGTIKWHAYMGNLRRGWMYCLPVSDTIIQIPELRPYKIGNETVDPLLGFARELERMAALYRVGGGTGCSIVRPDVSCVQDSHCALYSAIDLLLNRLGDQPKFRLWMARGISDPEVQRFYKLKKLGEYIENSITSFSTAPGVWKNFANNPLGTRSPSEMNILMNTILGKNTIFPRAAHDFLLHTATERGYPMWNILTVQVGGKLPGVTPLAPNSPRIR